MKLNLSKLNRTEGISIDIVERELEELGSHLELESHRYEKAVSKLDKFINHLSENMENRYVDDEL
ncbi:Protein involved in lantibiotic (srt) production / relaxase [Streptococcus sp. DD10]|uniref:helical hairpin domain-containing protein n=1 Tax=Streptococcus sp. DD10 TaxID=1777878 RepID=UPI000791771E|nr:Protein involved in lantibiotic (srt) production / relaxase [Streptococcus sp. DD10]